MANACFYCGKDRETDCECYDRIKGSYTQFTSSPVEKTFREKIHSLGDLMPEGGKWIRGVPGYGVKPKKQRYNRYTALTEKKE